MSRNRWTIARRVGLAGIGAVLLLAWFVPLAKFPIHAQGIPHDADFAIHVLNLREFAERLNNHAVARALFADADADEFLRRLLGWARDDLQRLQDGVASGEVGEVLAWIRKRDDAAPAADATRLFGTVDLRPRFPYDFAVLARLRRPIIGRALALADTSGARHLARRLGTGADYGLAFEGEHIAITAPSLAFGRAAFENYRPYPTLYIRRLHDVVVVTNDAAYLNMLAAGSVPARRMSNAEDGALLQIAGRYDRRDEPEAAGVLAAVIDVLGLAPQGTFEGALVADDDGFRWRVRAPIAERDDGGLAAGESPPEDGAHLSGILDAGALVEHVTRHIARAEDSAPDDDFGDEGNGDGEDDAARIFDGSGFVPVTIHCQPLSRAVPPPRRHAVPEFTLAARLGDGVRGTRLVADDDVASFEPVPRAAAPQTARTDTVFRGRLPADFVRSWVGMAAGAWAVRRATPGPGARAQQRERERQDLEFALSAALKRGDPVDIEAAVEQRMQMWQAGFDLERSSAERIREVWTRIAAAWSSDVEVEGRRENAGGTIAINVVFRRR